MTEPSRDASSLPEQWLSDGQRRAFIKVLLILGPMIVVGIGWMLYHASASSTSAELVIALLVLDAAVGYVIGRRFKKRPVDAGGSTSPTAVVGFVLAPALGLAVSRLLASTSGGSLVLGSVSVMFLLWLMAFLVGLHWKRLPNLFKATVDETPDGAARRERRP
jgi:hypothetical protein